MVSWLILTMWENESSVSVVKELSDSGKHICPDRHSEQEGWMKWDVRGYSDKQIRELADKIEKHLLLVADGDIRYEFSTE